MSVDRVHAVVAIIQKADTFLFVKRSDYTEAASGYWCPVSGRIEKGETQHEALKREVMEEVGLEVVAVRRVCSVPSADDKLILHFWSTEIVAGKAGVGSHEATEIRWVTLEQMRRLQPTFEEDVQILEVFAASQTRGRAQFLPKLKWTPRRKRADAGHGVRVPPGSSRFFGAG